MTISVRATLASGALVLLAHAAGCSLPRSPLGAPGPDAFVADASEGDGSMDAGMDAAIDDDAYVALDGGDLDAGDLDTGALDAGSDGGRDASALDAYRDDTGSDTGVLPDTGCTLGTTSCVGGNQLWQCSPDGAMRFARLCSPTCEPSPSAHCVELRATHVTDETLLPSGSTALVVPAGATVVIDSATGAITQMPSTVLRAAGTSSSLGAIGFSIQTQASGPDLGIFSFSTLTVESGGTLVGTGDRALVLLASGDVTIDGTIDVGGRGTFGGPGGYAGGGHRGDGSGPTPGGRGDIQGTFDDLMSGGGGGGHGGTGGRGGPEDPTCCATANGGAGGGVTSSDASGTPLLGGSGGGGGADGTSGGVGGGGGGIVQITSRTTIHITSGGVVFAPGAGGAHGSEAGGGGGAGGTIFLEALTVQLDGTVAVNGGGGGGGNGGGGDGGRGTSTFTAASGGSGSSGGGGGGAGAAGSTMAGSNGGEGNGGGGGGGGGGRISFVTMSGSRGTTGVVSPVDADREAAATIR